MNHETFGYGLEATQKSFKELEGLAAWLNIHGHSPIVIGGWATFFYVKGMGSRDIDLILPKTALPAIQKQQLNAKIWKDEQDIKALLALPLDQEKLEELLKKTGFKEEYENAASQL
ncbi:MAG: hypothetical protein V1494_06045 [Candidatus Diapherotrites archaeon]